MNQDRIKVLHIVSSLGSGGVEQILYNYYKNISKNNIVFDFIVHGYEEGVLEKKFEELGSTIYHVVPKKERFITNLKQIKNIIYNNNYDIVHCHQNFSSIIPLFLAYKKGVKVRIAHSHVSMGKKSIYNKILSSGINYFANYYFACGENAAKYLFGEKLYIKNRIYIMKNAISLEDFHYDIDLRNNMRNTLNLQHKFVLGHVGRFSEEKNHEFMIELIKKLENKFEDIILILIGEGNLEENIKEKVEKYNLSDRVQFLGRKQSVSKYMQAMDVLLLPSYYEGFGMVLLEGQGVGLKCIASDTITRDSKITNDLIFKQLKLDEWEKSIIEYYGGYYRKDNSIKLNEAGFNIKNSSKKLEEYYRQLYTRENLI